LPWTNPVQWIVGKGGRLRKLRMTTYSLDLAIAIRRVAFKK
jgi:hypothetical protein